ncbi:SHD1 domain-containing protein [Cerasicoccus arenae]|uniref:SLA1 homology domain-containing protein n=1 Tax=Cerasicoccus arenae TaxID=424488 RepID=A0A8J3GDZ4_9BACT|nr:SHD1 domain-containing protein [Cerasicoccus arenae]MBK1857507.1 hypothetical protein [Cerasicoccus arenae]GHB95417.1 hypothetical protein GCM10007047_08960 [Cerasicoccus arenae]
MTRLCCIAWIILSAATLSATTRTWTDTKGRQVEAEFVEVDHDHVKIKRVPDGDVFSIPIALLSKNDQNFIRQQTIPPPSAQPANESSPPPFDGLVWPRRVDLPDDYEVEVVREDSQTGEYIYRTPHFEFHSDVKLARKVVREFGKIFEGTYAAMQAFPLEWKPQPGETHFTTRLFAMKESYLAAGGLPNSGGVYLPSKREIWTPLSSLGVKKSSSSFTLDDSDDYATLIHEITHQVHHDWLQLLPQWIVEGMAVYMESVPYDDGQFRFDKRDVEDFVYQRSGMRLQKGNPVPMVPVERLMTISHAEWNRNFEDEPELLSQYYLSAFLLLNYYLHFDGEGEGRCIYAYCRALESGVTPDDAQAFLLDGRTYAEIFAELVAAYKREDLEIVIWRY